MVEYSEEIAVKICVEIANNRSLRSVCFDPDMPSMVAVFDWVKRYPEFAEQYRIARMAQADATYEDMIKIEERLDEEDISPQAAKVILDSMKWRAARMQPRKYGDAAMLRLSGPDDGPIHTDQQHKHDMGDAIEKINRILAKAKAEKEADK